MDEFGRFMSLAERMQFEADLGGAELIRPQCRCCKHFEAKTISCPAFPGGIPSSIEMNQYDHRRPYPTQVAGILWEPKHEAAKHPLEGAEP